MFYWYKEINVVKTNTKVKKTPMLHVITYSK